MDDIVHFDIKLFSIQEKNDKVKSFSTILLYEYKFLIFLVERTNGAMNR